MTALYGLFADAKLAFRFARRELRSGFAGFRIFFACFVLGVAAVSGVGSLAQALSSGIHAQGRTILGGDVAVGLVHRPATSQERRFFRSYGRISAITSMRAMAYAPAREDARQLVELKSVDSAYPLYGNVGLSPAKALHAALACSRTICGAVAEQSLLDRLKLQPGGLVRVGNAAFRISAVLVSEPDRMTSGLSLGPKVIVSDAGLARTGLVTLGSLINYSYRIALGPHRSVASFRSDAARDFAHAGFQITDRDHAAPGTEGLIDQVGMFLTLVGLTALAVAGVGAGQSVSAFLDRKREAIAALKALGAGTRLIFVTHLLQVMIIAAFAVVAGLLLGAVFPPAVQWLFGRELPVPAQVGVFGAPLLLAAVFGLLSALAFVILPLARTQEISPASLLRDIVAPARVRIWPYRVAASASALVVIAVAAAAAPSPVFACWFLLGVTGTLVLLRLAAAALRFFLRKMPHARNPSLRLAMSNLSRPGSSAASVITALGLSLTLLAAVTLIARTIEAQVQDSLPSTAPTFYFIDLQPSDTGRFDATIGRFRTAHDYQRTPMIRGRIEALNGVAAKDAKVADSARWALSGDRGITYATHPPAGTQIVQGHWWAPAYRGPTLISFDADLAQGLGLKLGDSLTLNILGREITGRIASLRNVKFSNGRQNFILILSPGIIDKAPHSYLATVRVAAADEEALYRAVTDRFPGVSVVRVKDVIVQIEGILRTLGRGVQAASLLTLLAGVLVLAGTAAAGQRTRIFDATVMKVLGATRAQIALIYGLEYGLLGILSGVIALLAGAGAAFGIAHWIFVVPLAFDPLALVLTVAGGGSLTLALGLLAAIAALSVKPAARLRNP